MYLKSIKAIVRLPETTEQKRSSTLFMSKSIYTDPQTGVVTEVNRNRNVRSRYR
jgi:Sec7-like guanine-nucleotide exchange factor